MMQSAAKPNGKAQTSVDLPTMNFERIIAMGYPFEPVKRVDARIEKSELRSIVEDLSVRQGLPTVIENFHLREGWDQSIFSFSFLDDMHKNSE